MNKVGYFFALCCCSIFFSSAQPGALDLSFDPGTGAGEMINAMAIQGDDRILIAGGFGSYDGAIYAGYPVISLHANGTQDTSFHSGTAANGHVYALALQSDGKILVGGEFRVYDGYTSSLLIRLNPDGYVDTSFHTGSGFAGIGIIRTIAIFLQNDGKILVGGIFTSYNGTMCNRIARLNIDGTIDSTFHPLYGPNGSVAAIAVQADDKILIAGDFTTFDGQYAFRVARMNSNGTHDTTFQPAGVDAVVHTLALQADQKIIVGGNFSAVTFQPQGKIVRLWPDAALDVFNHNQVGANSTVYDVKVLNSHKILVAGNFTTFDGDSIYRIALLDTNGYADVNFYPGKGANDFIRKMAFQSGGKIIIAGNFLAYDRILRNRIARLYNCFTPQPGIISGNDSTMCSQTFIYSIAPVADAQSYEWTLPAGWTGSSDSSSIAVVSNGQAGIISVRAFNDSCGFSLPQIKNIYRIDPPKVSICLVTVDTQSTHNIIYWEKPQTILIDSFFIYREVSTNTYLKIAAIPYDSLSEYHDLDANPNVTSYRYKISSADVCGVESDKSPYHSTIHFQNLGSGNFQWTFYQIENALNPVLSFNIYRDDLGNGNFFPIGNVPGTNATFTDINFSAFDSSIYVVDVNWSIACNPSRTVSTTRSNIRHRNLIDRPILGMEAIGTEEFEVFPNPGNGTFALHCPAHIRSLELFNSLGQEVWTENPVVMDTNITRQCEIKMLPQGFYTLRIGTNMGLVTKKIIIE